MINQSIIDYINQCRKLGATDSLITENLIAAGWLIQDITIAMQLNTDTPPKPATTSRRRWLWIVLLSLLLLLLVGAGIGIYWWYSNSTTSDLLTNHSQVEDAVDTQTPTAIVDTNTTIESSSVLIIPDDLQLEKIDIADASNAYDSFLTAVTEADTLYTQYPDSDELIEVGSWNQITAKTILNDNASALAALATATSLSAYQNPNFADPATLNFSGEQLFNPRELTNLNSINALSFMHDGNTNQAFKIVLDYLKLGHLITESQETIVPHAATNSAVIIYTLEVVHQLIQYGSTTSSTDLIDYAATLSQFVDDGQGIKKSFALDYAYKAETVDAIANGEAVAMVAYLDDDSLKKKFTDPTYFDPLATKQLMLDVTIQNAATIDVPCNAIQPIDLPDRLLIDEQELVKNQNILGQYVAGSANVGLSNIALNRCDKNNVLGATQLMLLLKAYYLDHDTLPASLDMLVPDYTSTLPLDVYTESQFEYDPAARTLTATEQGEKTVTYSLEFY